MMKKIQKPKPIFSPLSGGKINNKAESKLRTKYQKENLNLILI